MANPEAACSSVIATNNQLVSGKNENGFVAPSSSCEPDVPARTSTGRAMAAKARAHPSCTITNTTESTPCGRGVSRAIHRYLRQYAPTVTARQHPIPRSISMSTLEP